MATKANPGPFDCYAKAEPDEPLFVLLARDPLAPFLVSIWSSLRQGDVEAASVKFQTLQDRVAPLYGPAPDVDEASEALDCATAMFGWTSSRPARLPPSRSDIADAADDWRERHAAERVAPRSDPDAEEEAG